MLWRVQLVQIMAVIAAMIVGSFFPIPYLGVVLETVRLLLVMVFGVSLIYLGVLIHRDQLYPQQASYDDELLYAIELER
jgi:hypothetical protein